MHVYVGELFNFRCFYQGTLLAKMVPEVKVFLRLGVVGHTFNASTREVEGGGSV